MALAKWGASSHPPARSFDAWWMTGGERVTPRPTHGRNISLSGFGTNTWKRPYGPELNLGFQTLVGQPPWYSILFMFDGQPVSVLDALQRTGAPCRQFRRKDRPCLVAVERGPDIPKRRCMWIPRVCSSCYVQCLL